MGRLVLGVDREGLVREQVGARVVRVLERDAREADDRDRVARVGGRDLR